MGILSLCKQYVFGKIKIPFLLTELQQICMSNNECEANELQFDLFVIQYDPSAFENWF